MALAGLLLVVLSACSREAGPTPQGPGDDPGPDALRVKLNALTVDVCYRTPTEIDPPSCQKYVTQLASVPGTAREFARGDHPELAEAANALEKSIRAYRGNGCGTGGRPDACTESLVDMAEALGNVESGVLRLPEVSAQPS